MDEAEFWSRPANTRQHIGNSPKPLINGLLCCRWSDCWFFHHACCLYELPLETHALADGLIGPFELTKLSAQVSVLMASGNASSINATSMSDPANARATRAVAASYQNKGTFKTAKNIIKYRGFLGLYSGFSLHLRKSKVLHSDKLVRSG